VTSLALPREPHYSGSRILQAGDWAVTCAAYLLSIATGKEIAMSSEQHRNLKASQAADEALESLQHMTSWARQTVASPEAASTPTRFESVIEGFALGATAFHPGPWVHPIDEFIEADLTDARQGQPARPGIGMRTLLAIGAAAKRFSRYLRERRERAHATALLSGMDDRSLQDIGLSRSDIGRAVRHGRDWGRWH
jgi:uncharacterized protein YjiS (DUF1127 family)